MYRCIYSILFFFLLNTVSAQEIFEVGKVIDKVPVQGSSETFSLYLPTTYKPNEASAIVFIFDPSGNGNGGVQVFKDAAEQFNYILVCSNATRNGIPYETNFASINALSNTIFSTFKIDEKQIYAAGFSGGARLASAVAVLTNKFQAVIACGAGLALDHPYNPETNSFSFVGLVGDRDMNYREMLATKASFDKMGVQNELLIYHDTHSWPPKEQIQRAFEWLEIRAYEKKIRFSNQENVNSFYKKQYHLADSLRRKGRYLRSVHEYRNLEASFSGLVNTDSLRNKIVRLESSSKYQNEKSNELHLSRLENTLSEKFLSQFQKEVLMGKPDDNFT